MVWSSLVVSFSALLIFIWVRNIFNNPYFFSFSISVLHLKLHCFRWEMSISEHRRGRLTFFFLLDWAEFETCSQANLWSSVWSTQYAPRRVEVLVHSSSWYPINSRVRLWSIGTCMCLKHLMIMCDFRIM